jgi:cyclohexa-1,5-dienecarbonyl-CoA hydratase
VSYATLALTERHDGQLLEVALNAPPANILSAEMIGELRALLAAERAPSRRRAIVIGGAGQHFCYGASVAEHQAEQVGAMLPAFHGLLDDLLSHPVISIARVTGRCLGGGFELALGCTLLFADDSAQFAVPEIQLGVFPPVAAVLLPMLAGAALAPRMVLGAETLGAEALDHCGLLAARTAVGELDASVDAWISDRLLPRSASSLRCAHLASRAALLAHYRAHIGAAERLYLDRLMTSHDANEGIAAFLAKRPAAWIDA